MMVLSGMVLSLTKVALAGQGDIWRISDPIDAPANMKAVSLAYTLASIEYLHKFAPGDADFPKDDLTRLLLRPSHLPALNAASSEPRCGLFVDSP